MSTGPQHYAEAERLLTESKHAAQYKDDHDRDWYQRQAEVHAILALTAATALQHINSHEASMPVDDRQAWIHAASEFPAAQAARRRRDQEELAEFRASVRGAVRDVRETSTAEWFHAAVANGCTGTSYDSDSDTILHEDAPPCPVHEPGDVIPAGLRKDPR